MFGEAIYEIQGYNQNEFDTFLNDDSNRNDYDLSESPLSHVKTIGGIKL